MDSVGIAKSPPFSIIILSRKMKWSSGGNGRFISVQPAFLASSPSAMLPSKLSGEMKKRMTMLYCRSTVIFSIIRARIIFFVSLLAESNSPAQS